MKQRNSLPKPSRGGRAEEARDSFYRAFEDRFRGSRELIRSRLLVYLPFIEPLKMIHNAPSAVDLGCGRGEWLELLAEHGFNPQGVDLDEGMLAACHERGLRATKEDAIAFLKALPDASQAIVSGFHIAEHLPFPALQILMQEALRVLKPAGLLILETPNPENLKVSSLTFYLDPTHRHPLPPDLLSFLPEHYGYARAKVVRLQERRELLQSDTASLEQALGGSSPDYAVVAQKRARKAADARLFDEAFNKEFGIGAHTLVSRFDRQLAEQNQKAAALEARINEEHNAWVESLHKDLLVKIEALVRRDAELAQARETLAASQSRAKSLEAELVHAREVFAESVKWAKALEADLVAANETLAARDAELVGAREALARSNARVRSLEADLGVKAEALAERNAELMHRREALAKAEASAKSLLARLEALSDQQRELATKQGEAEARAVATAQILDQMSHTLNSVRAAVERRGLKRHLKRFEHSIRKRRDRVRERLKNFRALN